LAVVILAPAIQILRQGDTSACQRETVLPLRTLDRRQANGICAATRRIGRNSSFPLQNVAKSRLIDRTKIEPFSFLSPIQ
jgi:hypothetical protein